jgi:formamidopyrimidine-DNA glycosylase
LPELPEVETTARGLRKRVVGLRVVTVGGVDWPRMLPNATEADLARVLVGRAIVGVERRGKYLLLEFEDDITLAIHRKMSGNLLLRPGESPRELHTHLELGLSDGTLLRLVDPRKFGRVYLFLSSAELAAFVEERLGPEPFLEPEVLDGLLRGRRGRIKSLLLDQSFLAGVGNLYADEALWEAQIHPLRPADSLSEAEVARLALAIQQVLQAGIDRRGTSFSTYLDADGEPGANQEFLRVYGRFDQPCPRCGSPIRRLLIGQRTSHFCPECQAASSF